MPRFGRLFLYTPPPMKVLPEFLDMLRKQVHTHEAEVRPKFTRWTREHMPSPGEHDADTLIAEYDAVRAVPRTFEGQAQWFAARVVVEGWGRRDIPKDFHPEVQRLVSAMR